MAVQAKCEKCKVVYFWGVRYEIPLRQCFCPTCGSQLQRTSALCQWPWVYDATGSDGHAVGELARKIRRK